MTRDALIIAFAKLRAARHDACAVLLAAAASLPRRQYAAFAREVEAVAALFEAACPAPKSVDPRPEPEPRKGCLPRRARDARRQYLQEHRERLSAQERVGIWAG